MYTKKSRGFTLIELLVVIAIIGILASVVLVSLSGQTGKANRSAFLSESKGNVAPLVSQCDDATAGITAPNSTGNITWAEISDTCTTTGTKRFVYTATNVKAFPSTAAGACVLRVGENGVWIDAAGGTANVFDPGEAFNSSTSCL